jgi:two-component system CheB/CheR fusion protein
MDNYRFKVVSPRSGRIKQVDIFFISLANEMSDRAVGIVLSGYGSDGTVGCKHIKANGGKTFAQDMSAEVDFMPLSAQAAGCADFVLPLNKIPAKLKRLAAALKT